MTNREVECLICGEVCQGRLTYHLKKVHNLTTRDYREEFPGASVLCKDEEDSIKKRLTERNKSEKQRAIVSQRNRDPEFQRKCQEGQNYIVEIKYEDDLIINYKDKVNAAVDFCKTNGFVYCYVNRFSGISRIRDLGFSSVAVLQRI